MIICFRTTKTLINFTVEKKSKKMETRYISPEKFSKVSKGKKVIHYPNEWIKDVNGIRYHIVNPNMEYKISELEQKSYPWYLGMTFDDYSKTVKEMFGDDDARVFVLECDWFPTELVAGINNGRYSNTSSLSRKTGWIRTFGAIELFRAEMVKEAISILNKHGFKFDMSQLRKAV